MVETRSVASFVSVQVDESHNTPPKSTEAEVSWSCGNAGKKDLSSTETQKSKVKRPILTDYQLDRTVPTVVKRDKNQQSVVLNGRNISSNWSGSESKNKWSSVNVRRRKSCVNCKRKCNFWNWKLNSANVVVKRNVELMTAPNPPVAPWLLWYRSRRSE